LTARRRRARRRAFLATVGILICAGAAIAAYVWQDRWLSAEYDGDLQFAEDAAYRMPEQPPVFVPAIVDLAGDPIWISLAREAAREERLRDLARPVDLAEPGISDRVSLLSDLMISAGEQFMTTIPATQEDFAFFQANRSNVRETAPSPHPDPDFNRPDDAGHAAPNGDAAAGWGETIDGSEAALPAFRRTEIGNNTSLAITARQSDRYRPTEDRFVRVLVERSLESVILEGGRFSVDDARRASEALNPLFGHQRLAPGHVVALRGLRTSQDVQTLSLMQVSVYADDTYVGTLARNDAGDFVAGIDPWVRDDLFNYSGAATATLPGQQYRLLDAIYSTAARNNVPTEVIGEAIMYLSRAQDLNAFAAQDDRLALLYSKTARGPDGAGGRVLYVGVRDAQRRLECYVFPQSEADYACISGDAVVRGRAVAGGMITPVDGVLTSGFGPRKHPILKTVRIHKGVDWAAPAGTPILAAFDGTIAFRGDGGGYGNVVRIAHADGSETRYAHMQRFAESATVGTSVKAGDTIGYVGTTGLSTGPHLHFELYRQGSAVDPLATAVVAVSDGSAVEILVDNIIRVESAGNPRAKNPLSTATGLGQFIESTWIRMMNTYRPDLAQTLSRGDLLALRFDPTISREMVRNLAREGEAYLRARGHQITAGRLYLCHFLGMDGAHRVLASAQDRSLLDVLGASVINANPFLRGRKVAYILDWAEAKMRGGNRARQNVVVAAQPQTMQTSPEFERYKTAVLQLMESAIFISTRRLTGA
jgi:murein DD-endopeptidase MepM/ murein hydrolase activator NlpD